MNDIFEFPFNRSVALKSPYKSDNRVVYHLWVNVRDIPEGFPTQVNPREVKDTTKVYKRIADGLTESTESFFVNNRGILISAKSIGIDSISKAVKLNLGEENEKDKFGVLDGGHTYHAIIKHRNKIDNEINQYVHLEIMTNVNEIDELSAARNTSVQVSDKAIAELANKFEFVKEALKNEDYANDIAYRENDDKRLDTIDLVRLMYSFNAFKYAGSNSQPIQAYSGKAQVLKDYLKNYDHQGDHRNDYEYIAPLLPTITKLYDQIEIDMRQAYLDNNPKGAFGKVKGIDSKKTKPIKSKFYQHDLDYQITQGFIFPILASFRALVEIKEDNHLEWAVDPFKVWQKIKAKLVNNTIEMSRQLGHNPQSTGKSSALWVQNYDAVTSAKLQLQIEEMNKQSK
ncbi:AIPR family protein [Salinicoccus roseus]|uniref:AIPR family protein n=1 Tax=Salinicoccus roseus TaxID=45670 RepID=UPI001CA6CF24|nr:AIPR family protein [Salinicoccus roseus]MBY8910027.1 AIPR family protein [Salinicoccus roseus]